eukprot:5532359-Pleurochrysis_carterae.AAC.4
MQLMHTLRFELTWLGACRAGGMRAALCTPPHRMTILAAMSCASTVDGGTGIDGGSSSRGRARSGATEPSSGPSGDAELAPWPTPLTRAMWCSAERPAVSRTPACRDARSTCERKLASAQRRAARCTGAICVIEACASTSAPED